MARVTVEDCIVKIPNRFELVMVASQRAREIGAGAAMMVEKDNDKNPVIALREIADTEMSIDTLRESLIKNHQKVVEVEESETDALDMMEGESEWAAVAAEAAADEVEDAGLHEEDFSDLDEGDDGEDGAADESADAASEDDDA